MNNKPRKPWVAGVLTFISIGLGHLYFGNIKRGIILFLLGVFFSILALSTFLIDILAGLIIVTIFAISYKVYCIVDSVKGAGALKEHYLLRKYNKWYVYLLYLIAALFISNIVKINFRSNILQAFKIPSGAMEETIQTGDHIFANKFIYKNSEPNRGDIIIFPFPDDPSMNYIKRVIGLGGETIEIRDKDIIINGNVLQESYTFFHDSTVRESYGPIEIPKDSLFVLGDNRDNSMDSRHWGVVKSATVMGKAIGIYWSWDSESFSVRWNRIGKELK